MSNPKYPHSAAWAQAQWLAQTLGPGWEPHVGNALVDRGISTTDANVWTFWAQRGIIRVKPVQVVRPEKEYADHDLALLAAEALQYTCYLQRRKDSKWPQFGIPVTPTSDPKHAVATHLAALSRQIQENQTLLALALAALADGLDSESDAVMLTADKAGKTYAE